MPGFFSSLASYIPGVGSNIDANTPSSPDEESLAISQLVVYPIKSCRGISLESSAYDVRGLKWDRRWMIVQAEGEHKMVTARTAGTAKLLLVEPSFDLENQQLRIHIPNHGTHAIPLDILAASSGADRIDGLQVWRSYDMAGHVVTPLGTPLQKALSAFLGFSILLVQFDDSTPRVLGDSQYLGDLFGAPGLEDALEYPVEEATTLFADGLPFLVAAEASFSELSGWLRNETVDIRMDEQELRQRYRPNIVVSGGKKGFQEDGWEELLVTASSSSSDTEADGSGGETIYPVSRCVRCPMPDVSPETGTMSARRMPGRILENHRKGVDRINRGMCFGVNAIPKKREGMLKVGDRVAVKRYAARNEEGEKGRVRGEWLRAEDTWN